MRFLVAYDNTDGARAALTAATSLARASSADVTVLHVVDPRSDAADVSAPTTREAVSQVMAGSRAAIEALGAALGVTLDIRIEPLTRGEDDWEHIVHTAQDLGVDLIAIGSRRAGGLVGGILGSVTRAVVQHAHCPVLVVRPDQAAAT